MVALRKLGEVAELVFMSRAAALGLTILKPNSPCRYDLALDTGPRIVRVQVKSTATLRAGRYPVSCFACDSRRRYTPSQIDFLAAWVVPHNAWYIIPATSLRHRARIYFYPSTGTGWSSRFRERWDLLLCRGAVSTAPNGLSSGGSPGLSSGGSPGLSSGGSPGL